MSRIARDSPGMERNVPRPGQVHSGTMKRPGMKFYGAQFARFCCYTFQKSESKKYLQQNKHACAEKLSTEFVKIELLTQLNIDRSINYKSFPKSKAKALLLCAGSKKESM